MGFDTIEINLVVQSSHLTLKVQALKVSSAQSSGCQGNRVQVTWSQLPTGGPVCKTNSARVVDGHLDKARTAIRRSAEKSTADLIGEEPLDQNLYSNLTIRRII